MALRPILDVARDLDLAPEQLVLYGNDKAKVRLDRVTRDRPPGRLVLVSAITPTDAGEGKTTTAIGLAQGLKEIGEKVCLALREPSLGPVFGLKGGATGGGLASVHPEEDINLHFTGDFHAISAANNLLAAMLDNHLYHGNDLGIDPRRVFWRRVIDLNDRALREVIIGLGGPLQGMPRETGFDITPASEVMATLCLANDLDDLRKRLARTLVAMSYDRTPVTAGDLGAVGAMMVLLKDAVHPNLVQSTSGVPTLIHGGPFANIAHGCNSVFATKLAMSLADWTITEAGFGFDLGAEKFFDIKCTSAGLDTAAVVLVATVRALKMHGGRLQSELDDPDPGAVEKGLANLEKHVESIRHFGEPPVIAINRFPTDTDEEVAVIQRACERLGVPSAISEGVAKGAPGGVALAEQVVAHAEKSSDPFHPLYDWSEPVKTKMQKIARNMYGSEEVVWTRQAEKNLRMIHKFGYDKLPLCVAKTQKSLSDDPRLLGRPRDFELTVERVVVAAGAGFLVPILGDILRMPGLRKVPQAVQMDLDGDGHVVGMT